MKLKFALTGAACCVLLAGFANGQTQRYPSRMRPISLTTDYYSQDTEASPSDRPQASEVSNSYVSSSKGSKGGDCGCVDACCCDLDIVHWFPEIGCGWNLTGWLALGATANTDRPATRINGPMMFNDPERIVFEVGLLYPNRTFRKSDPVHQA